MNRPARRLKMADLNPHFTCVLCDGYFVDATTIVECLHSFCRACIVKYLETNKFCPVCDVQVHKTKPLLSIRSDKTLQDVVYKLVPGLYQNEMKRRREFYSTRPEEASRCTSEERGEETNQRFIYTPYETISLSMEYLRRDDGDDEGDGSAVDSGHEVHGDEVPPKRYLLCPAAISVGHLKKFITAKYDLPSTYKVEISYSDDILNENYTLMDVAYNYGWKRTGPMRFCYRIVTSLPKRRKLFHPPPLECPAPPPAPAPTSSNNLEVPKKTSSDLSSLSLVPSPSSSKQELKFVLRPRREEKDSSKHKSSAAATSAQDSHDTHKPAHSQQTSPSSRDEPKHGTSHHHHHHHHRHHQEQQKITVTFSNIGLKRSSNDSNNRESDSAAPAAKVRHGPAESASGKSNYVPVSTSSAAPAAQPVVSVSYSPMPKSSSKRPTRARVKNRSVGRPALAKLAPYPSSTTTAVGTAISTSAAVNHFVPSPVTCFASASPAACLAPASCIGSLSYLTPSSVTCFSSAAMNHGHQSDAVKSSIGPIAASIVHTSIGSASSVAPGPKTVAQSANVKTVNVENCGSGVSTSVAVCVNGFSSPESTDNRLGLSAASINSSSSKESNSQVPGLEAPKHCSVRPEVTRKNSSTMDDSNKCSPPEDSSVKNVTAALNTSTTTSCAAASQNPETSQPNTVSTVAISTSEPKPVTSKCRSKSPNIVVGKETSNASSKDVVPNDIPNGLSPTSSDVFSGEEKSCKPDNVNSDSSKDEKKTQSKSNSQFLENVEVPKTSSGDPVKGASSDKQDPEKKLPENHLDASPSSSAAAVTAEKNAINLPFKEVKSSTTITAEFSDNDDLGCQPDLVVDEQKLDSSDNEDDETEDDALRRKITAIAEKDDEVDVDIETDSGRASDVSNQARSSCDDEGGSPAPNPTPCPDERGTPSSLVVSCAQKYVPSVSSSSTSSSTTNSVSPTVSTSPTSPSRTTKNGDEHVASKPNGIDHIINNLHRNHERKDNIGALDLSTSNRKTVQQDVPRPRPRAVANPPVLDAKHRQQTCLPAPTKQHTACVPVPKHPTSSTFHIGALSASARHAVMTASQSHLNKMSPVSIPHFNPSPILNSLPMKSTPANAHFCRTPSPMSIHPNPNVPAFPTKTYSPVPSRQNNKTSTTTSSQLAPMPTSVSNSYHGKSANANSSPRRDSVPSSPSTTTSGSPHHRLSPSVTSPKSNATSPSTTPSPHVLAPPVPSTSSYKISRPPIPMYSKKSDSYKNSHHHRFKGNLTVINPDPNGYSQKIVIKNLNPGQSNNHQRV